MTAEAIDSQSASHALPGLLERDGFAVVPDCLSATECETLAAAVQSAMDADNPASAVSRQQTVYALRNLTDVLPEAADLAQHPRVAQLVAAVLGPNAFLTRGILFDKRPEANWGLFWHRDLTIAVDERAEIDGFGPWSKKAGAVCVQPPLDVLADMLTVRLHLDGCGPENGPLRVLPGSHHPTAMSPVAISRMEQSVTPVSCHTAAGGCVLMRPLLLHGSPPAQAPGRRRVIHLEFAARPLPAPLRWANRIPLGLQPSGSPAGS